MIANLDQLVTELNNKADKDLINADSSRSYLIESFKSGRSFYRLYSDGWCVQGGFLNDTSAAKYVKVNFLKEYKDNDYAIVVCACNDLNVTTAAPGLYFNGVSYKERDGFQVWMNTDITYSHKNWIAMGYVF